MKKTVVAMALAICCSLPGLGQAEEGHDYVMCPGDQLQVIVYGHDDLSSGNGSVTPYIVRPDGKVMFPLIGEVDVTGKTVAEFTQALTDSFAEYLVKPRISVNILKMGTTRVYVLGEVRRPGMYELEKSHSVLDALSKAEGFTDKTAKKKIYLIRRGATEPILVNINDYLKKADQKQNYILQEGDCLYLTSNNKIDFSRDIMPFISAGYMINDINED